MRAFDGKIRAADQRASTGHSDMISWCAGFILCLFAEVAVAQQSPRPPPPDLSNPNTGANTGLLDFFSPRTPYEFWLTCIIMGFGLAVIVLLLWHLRTIADRHAEDVGRAVVVVTVIVGALILVTAGYSNDQIAPAFGLLGTIVGYILGRLPRVDSGRRGSREPVNQVNPVSNETPRREEEGR